MSQYDRGNRNDWVFIPDVTVKRSTEKAGLFVTDDGTEVWIPWSQVQDGSVDRDGETGDLIVRRWIAEEKEMEYEEDYS